MMKNKNLLLDTCPEEQLYCAVCENRRSTQSTRRQMIDAYRLLCFRVGWLEFDRTKTSLLPPSNPTDTGVERAKPRGSK